MGIDGFLRHLSDAVDRINLQQFAGLTLLVDALSWLHKACYGCAYELSTGKDTDKYVQYMLRRVDMMRSCGVAQVILVFDGQQLPLKLSTQEKRKSYKDENRKRALQAMASSKRLQGYEREDEMKKAYQLFQRSVSITPAIIFNVMNALRVARIPFVVAPFEADAQMAWMYKEGLAAGIVTEDSDVVVYCLTANVRSPVIVKLEDNGSAQAVSRSILHNNSAKASTNALLRKIHFLSSGGKEATRMFVQACVLAGCDFLDSLPNIGFATAVKHIYNFRGAPASLRVHRLVSKLTNSGTKVPTGFMQQFMKAETVFYHHIVFDSTSRSCEFLVKDSHDNCFSDILQHAKESLGIASKEKALALRAQKDTLHSVVTSTKSYLGQVRSRVIVEQIYMGEVCARTFCTFSEILASSQSWQSDKVQSENKSSVDTPQSGKEAPNNVFKAKRGTLISCQKATLNKIAQQLETKRRSQAQERASSLQGLMSAYKTAARSEAPAAYMVTNSLREIKATHAMRAISARMLSSTSAAVKFGTVTAKDIITKHSHSVTASTSGDPQAGTLRVVLQSTASRKRPLKPVTSCARKFRTLAPKKAVCTGEKTMLDFFLKT